jgi:hypothetical protein
MFLINFFCSAVHKIQNMTANQNSNLCQCSQAIKPWHKKVSYKICRCVYNASMYKFQIWNCNNLYVHIYACACAHVCGELEGDMLCISKLATRGLIFSSPYTLAFFVQQKLFTFQVLSIFTQVNIPGPSDESLIGPHKRVCINALTLMSSHSKSLQDKVRGLNVLVSIVPSFKVTLHILCTK